MMYYVMYIQLVEERVAILEALANTDSGRKCTYLRYRRSKDNNLIEFSNTLHELIDTRPFNNIYIVVLSFNFNWNCEVCLMEYLTLLGGHLFWRG